MRERINSSRRAVLAGAAALGATVAWGGKAFAASRGPWRETRALYPQGVASGDPDANSVLLWTRRPFDDGKRHSLTVEIASDAAFARIVSRARTAVEPEADWTCRVLAAGLRPATTYWYRFTDADGNGSRIGRTRTAPADNDARTVRFAFASCQTINEGALNAYRRMIWEDERAPADEQLDFVLHLGDFIYEVVQYPDEVKTRYDRTIFDIGRVPNARKVGNFYVPTDLAGYRMVYRAHLDNPELQDARARFPFVCIGDNHEFSWQGWQSTIQFNGKSEPAQQLRVDANQAWWEFIPARVRKASGSSLARFDPPTVTNVAIDKFDDHGLGLEPNNLAALASMTAYRALRYGRNVELIITDLHSYMMDHPVNREEANPIAVKGYSFLPEEALQVLDGGRAYAGGNPPATVPVAEGTMANYRKDEPPFSLLGAEQKTWFKARLATSRATWKIWAASTGTLDYRIDPQNLPAGLAPEPWPLGYASTGGRSDFGATYHERAEIYDHVRDRGIDGFVTVSGDRHSFWAGYAAKALPPKAFEPVGIAFIGGSMTSPGMVEGLEHASANAKKHPLRPLFMADRAGGKPEATCNLMFHHGVRSALEYARSGDIEKARAVRNPDLSPHLEFIDMAGHGYSVVRASADAIETEFVCIPRPIRLAATPDGGPLRYRVVHRAARWRAGERPKLEQRVIEGDAKLSI